MKVEDLIRVVGPDEVQLYNDKGIICPKTLLESARILKNEVNSYVFISSSRTLIIKMED